MTYFGKFYLDREKDMIVEMDMNNGELSYVLRTPNHHTGNLITNLARLCQLPLSYDEKGLKIIEGKIPCYIDGNNRRMYIFRLGNTKVANIFTNGEVEMKASIPSISKTLMSQTKNYTLDEQKTIIKTYILADCKFRSDLHTHMNANLHPDVLIALGIRHQIRYPLYYIKKLSLKVSDSQQEMLDLQREAVALKYQDSGLSGKYLSRKIDDNTFINFADLILNNIENAEYNLPLIRASLSIMKDGQAVFTNLEKVYVYRYVFTKGIRADYDVEIKNIERIPDREIVTALGKMLADQDKPQYQNNTLFQNKLLWIARGYAENGIEYVEMSDTSLVKREEALNTLRQIHQVMPEIYKETGVLIRFLAALRRVPLTLIRDKMEEADYIKENLRVLRAVACDPYVAGSDIVGEEVNDVRELESILRELADIASENENFVLRVHAGENDSLRDNVYNSISTLAGFIKKDGKQPEIRIGHGLHTAPLKSEKGQQLIKLLKENRVILEFQLTSNVRLNNLYSLKRHPLKQYLQQGIPCVQGTDGAALYGTSSIDEQLSLEKLLNLTHEEMLKMREYESRIIEMGFRTFMKKKDALKEVNEEELLQQRLQSARLTNRIVLFGKKLNAYQHLKERIADLPWDKMPIVIAGGSFNNDNHVTKVYNKRVIRELLEKLDPEKYFFVIGDRLSGYEEFLVKENAGRFTVFAMVPAFIDRFRRERLLGSGVNIRISTELSSMGLYKSINYEIFERRESIVIVFDGSSSAMNLIQEAKNGKGHAHIFLNEQSRPLKVKSRSLQGYVQMFNQDSLLADEIIKIGEAKS